MATTSAQGSEGQEARGTGSASWLLLAFTVSKHLLNSSCAPSPVRAQLWMLRHTGHCSCSQGLPPSPPIPSSPLCLPPPSLASLCSPQDRSTLPVPPFPSILILASFCCLFRAIPLSLQSTPCPTHSLCSSVSHFPIPRCATSLSHPG